MLNKVTLHNFKCYANATFELKNLTLLSGINGVGKSSFIQSLLTIQQTTKEGSLGVTLTTNGHLVNLGTIDDVLYEKAEEASIRITIEIDDLSFVYEYMKIHTELLPLINSEENESLSEFSYLCAERFGPRAFFPIPSPNQSYYNRIGNHGEYAAHLLELRGEDAIAHKNLILSEFPNSLRGQTEAWLSRLGRTLRIHTDSHPHMDSVNLQYSYLQGKLYSKQYRSTNVGFGITYTLPIFVAVLSAPIGEVIVIENPEAHLHPKGQAIMGEFLALAAQAGIQLIVETHSDHVLNGIRVAVKKGRLSPENLCVHFFSCSDNNEPLIISPQIDADGRFDQWPDDFFDEWDKQLSELIGD